MQLRQQKYIWVRTLLFKILQNWHTTLLLFWSLYMMSLYMMRIL